MAELSAFILAYNEAENIPSLMDSLKGIKDIVVLDNGSTDDTVKMFRERGARVYIDDKRGKYAATEQDVEKFREMFGFAPLFVAGEIFGHAGERRNYAASLCRNDWVFNPDCDERPEWDLKKVKAMLNGQDAIGHRYVFKHNPNGTPLIEFIQCKLYNRRKGQFFGRIHEVLVARETGKPSNTTFSPDIVVHHWQKDREYRSYNCKQMEFQVVKEETARTLHYLAREYFTVKDYEKGLKAYDRYFAIEGGDFKEQKSAAWVYRAGCLRELGRIDEAVHAYHEAMICDSKSRDPYFDLGQLYLTRGDFKTALVWFTAATAIPYNPQGFLNDMRLYTWATNDMLSVCYQNLGMTELAQKYWLKAFEYLPMGPAGTSDAQEGARILANAQHMGPIPQRMWDIFDALNEQIRQLKEQITAKAQGSPGMP